MKYFMEKVLSQTEWFKSGLKTFEREISLYMTLDGLGNPTEADSNQFWIW